MMKKVLLTSFFFFSLSALAKNVVNDPFFSRQWSLHNDGTSIVSIDIDRTHTLRQQGVVGFDIGWLESLSEVHVQAKSPVTVAVIDSGVDYQHPDLQGALSAEGWDFLENSALLTDDIGHGICSFTLVTR